MKQSQTRRLLDFMKANGGVTAMSAFSYLNITSIHRRLADLQKQGVDIVSKWDGTGTSKYKVYRLATYERFKKDPYRKVKKYHAS